MRNIKLWDEKQKTFLTKFYCFYKDGIFEFYNNDRDFENGIMNTNVIVVESTGLKDKNDVEIYEGDIAKVLVAYTDYDGCEYKRPSRVYNHKTKYVNIAVSFESGTFILDTDYTDSLGNTLWLWTQEDVEVIGNIYENPELLN